MKYLKRIYCWLSTAGLHDPILREDMRYGLPGQKIDSGRGIVFDLQPRDLWYGPTECRKCGKKADLKGSPWIL